MGVIQMWLQELLIKIAVILIMVGYPASQDTDGGEQRLDEGSVRRLYDKIFATLNSAKYDRRIRPHLGEKPVAVTVFMRVLSLRSISEATMDYRLELFFREKWLDPRLAYNAEQYDNQTEISLHESLTERLWMPDTFLPNAVKSRNPNSGSVTHRSLLRLFPDGSVLFSRRLSVTAECPMDLTLYPFDQQVCVLSIESYGHSVKELYYHWREHEAVVLEKLVLPDYQLKRVDTRSRNVTVATGTYSRLECCFFFERSAGFFFIQLFLPATAIVFTSWILLWMGRGSNFSDMIAIILAVTFLYFSYTAMMPRVSYVKAMDIYLGACFVHVFLSMAHMAAKKFNEAHGPSAEGQGHDEPVSHIQLKIYGQEMIEKSSSDSPPPSEPTFRYLPTPRAVDVSGSTSGTGKPKPNERGFSFWKKVYLRRAIAFVAHIPIYAILISFLLFWVFYFVAFFCLAIDTDDDKCHFS